MRAPYTLNVAHYKNRSLPVTVGVGIAVLSLALLLLSAPRRVYAQDAERACGDFSFAADSDPAERRVQGAEIVEAVKQGCEINATRAIIEGKVSFRGSLVFAGRTDFSVATFEEEVNFAFSTFRAEARFRFTTFAGRANCSGFKAFN